ncbi:MAG: TolB family protein [Myxococcota bacterium]
MMRSDFEENIFVSKADGSKLRGLTFDASKRSRLPRWAADGKEVMFYSTRSGPWAGWTVAADGSRLRKLAEVPDRNVLYLCGTLENRRAGGDANRR